jgi:hypothetical protein
MLSDPWSEDLSFYPLFQLLALTATLQIEIVCCYRLSFMPLLTVGDEVKTTSGICP